MKKLFLLPLCLLICNIIIAAPLKYVPQKLNQPDGSILNCFASGDEYYNWLHDKNGYTIVHNPETNYWVYAKKTGSSLTYSDYIPGKAEPELLKLEKWLIPDKNEIKIIYEQKKSAFNNRNTIQNDNDKSLLKVNDLSKKDLTRRTMGNLVIFIRFADDPEFSKPISKYKSLFNDTIENSKSIRKFFKSSSFNQLDVESYFVQSPEGQTIVSYKDEHIRGYYQSRLKSDSGYTTNNAWGRFDSMLVRAGISITGKIPENLSDISNIIFIVYGWSEGWAEPLWPHMGACKIEINGQMIYTYNLQFDNDLSSYALCHEFFHSVGAPDLYHYSFIGSPVGGWDLMELGNTISSYMRYKYGKWIKSLPEIAKPGDYKLRALTAGDSMNVCFKVQSPSDNEYFLLEYRDDMDHNEGLLVYRINMSFKGNASGPPDEVYVYRRDGDLNSDGDTYNSPFSQYLERTEFNDFTNPACFLSNGNMGCLKISGIKVDKGARTVLFHVDTLFTSLAEKEITVYNKSNSGLPSDDVKKIAIEKNGDVWAGTSNGLAKFDGTNWALYNMSNSKLPDNVIREITVDLMDNKWIGTWKGLAKFDGAGWTIYNMSNSGMPDDGVAAIATDSKNIKWIGIPKGLVKFDGLNWTVYNQSNSGLPEDYITNIAIDSKDNMWIGTLNRFVKFDGTNWIVYNPDNYSAGPGGINTIAIDASGNKWIGTCESGLAKFDGTNWTIYKERNSGKPINLVIALNTENLGNIWFGQSEKLVKFDGNNWTENQDLPDLGYIYDIKIGYSNKKWIASASGLYVLNDNIYIPKPEFVTGLADMVLEADKVFEYKVQAVDKSNTKIKYTKLKGPEHLTVDATTGAVKWLPGRGDLGNSEVVIISCNVWGKWDTTKAILKVVLDKGYNGWTNHTKYNSSINSNKIAAIFNDKNGNMWIGTNEFRIYNLTKFDGKTWTEYDNLNSALPLAPVSCFADDCNGNLWMHVLNRGLVKYDGKTWTLYNYENSNFSIYESLSLACDHSGNLWIGSRIGLAKFDGKNSTLYNKLNSKLPGNEITSVYVDKKNNIWIATANAGAAKFDGKEWIVFTQSNSGLTSDSVRSAFLDNYDNMWFATNAGIVRFDGKHWDTYLGNIDFDKIVVDKTGNIWGSIIKGKMGLMRFDGINKTFYNTENSALPCDSITALAINNGRVYVGTADKGFAEFDEASISDTLNKRDINVPYEYTLFQNYPNPFNPTTRIRFGVPEGCIVKLTIYDLLGKKVASLIDGQMRAGYHEVDWNASHIASGVYFCELRTEKFSAYKKMLILK